jgi:diaminohydroxyphosphoribosylaminopyrimidine deaminase/5-amino-6-(5-phosphoribosylamino)uracil reductase
MPDSQDKKFMERCLELALNAEGMTYPNPLVGSVLVRDGIIIGEGFHLKAGLPHAEVNAINSVADKSLLRSSALYVNLEPCSHFGKTPPCADFIIACGIPRVVIGTLDTSKKVSGNGLKKLKDAGCEVVTGVLENECRWVNRRFFTFHEKGRPYIILKWAQSADGYIDMPRKESQNPGPRWISGKPERCFVHRWRASEGAILAGAGTIRADDPVLNVRNWTGADPLRLILSGSGNLPGNAAVFRTGGENIIFTYNIKVDYPDSVKVLLSENKPPSLQILEYLYTRGIQSLLIEGGTKVLDYFISGGLWDEARIFKGNVHFAEGVKAPVISGNMISRSIFRGSTLEFVLNDYK